MTFYCTRPSNVLISNVFTSHRRRSASQQAAFPEKRRPAALLRAGPDESNLFSAAPGVSILQESTRTGSLPGCFSLVHGVLDGRCGPRGRGMIDIPSPFCIGEFMKFRRGMRRKPECMYDFRCEQASHARRKSARSPSTGSGRNRLARLLPLAGTPSGRACGSCLRREQLEGP